MSDERKWTPGPWRVVGKFGLNVYAMPMQRVAEVNDLGKIAKESAEANAQLIAKAPELFDALERLVAAINTSEDLLPSIREAERVLGEARGR